MSESVPSLNDAAWRMISEQTGRHAKCAFMLSVLSSETASSSEKAAASEAIVDDFDRITRAVSRTDLVRLNEVVQGATVAATVGSPWVARSYPDESLSGAEQIDGTNVSRVVVPKMSRTATTVDLARIEAPRNGHLTIVSEYTFLSTDTATLEIVDESSLAVLAALDLECGHNRLAVCAIDPEQDVGAVLLLVRITNYSESEPVFWYQATALQDRIEDRPSVADQFHESSAAPSVGISSVFTPVTGEPLTLNDVDRMTALRNRFAGERIFIMGNGPSLNQTPLDLLENEFVFGVNRISLLFDRVSWRPTFFTAFDVRVVPDNKAEFAALDVPFKFFSARYKSMMGERENHYWYHTKAHYQGFEASFEPTVTYSGFGGGGTIGVIAIELAFFLGFREMYLIGTDVSYSVPTTVKQAGPDQFGDGVKLELESTRDDDQNHFDPSYFGKDKKWHNPNVREMKIGFARAAAYVERRGGILRNATVGGELNEVPRVDFTSLF